MDHTSTGPIRSRGGGLGGEPYGQFDVQLICPQWPTNIQAAPEQPRQPPFLPGGCLELSETSVGEWQAFRDHKLI
jgi:hypothetical protein